VLAAAVPYFYNILMNTFQIQTVEMPSDNFWTHTLFFITFFCAITMIELLIFVRKEVSQVSEIISSVAKHEIENAFNHVKLQAVLATTELAGVDTQLENENATRLIKEIALASRALPPTNRELGLFLFSSMVRESRVKLGQVFGPEGACLVIDKQLEITRFLQARTRSFFAVECGIPNNFREQWTNGWIELMGEVAKTSSNKCKYYFVSSHETLKDNISGARSVNNFLKKNHIDPFWCDIENFNSGLRMKALPFDAIEFYDRTAVCSKIELPTELEQKKSWRGEHCCGYTYLKCAQELT
jgi:hypothetical protein